MVITGAALGLPGTDHIFDDGNIARLLNGDQFIAAIPDSFRRAMLDKNITRLMKSESGEGKFPDHQRRGRCDQACRAWTRL